MVALEQCPTVGQPHILPGQCGDVATAQGGDEPHFPVTGFGCARFRMAARRATVWRMCMGSLSNLVGLLIVVSSLGWKPPGLAARPMI